MFDVCCELHGKTAIQPDYMSIVYRTSSLPHFRFHEFLNDTTLLRFTYGRKISKFQGAYNRATLQHHVDCDSNFTERQPIKFSL